MTAALDGMNMEGLVRWQSIFLLGFFQPEQSTMIRRGQDEGTE